MARSSPEPILRTLGRREVHGDALHRPGAPAREQRGTHAAARLAAGASGDPTTVKRRQPGAAVDLDGDGVAVDAEQGGGRDDAEHGALPGSSDRREGRPAPAPRRSGDRRQRRSGSGRGSIRRYWRDGPQPVPPAPPSAADYLMVAGAVVVCVVLVAWAFLG